MATVLLIVGLVALFLCGLFCGIAIKAYHASEAIRTLEEGYQITLTKKQAD